MERGVIYISYGEKYILEAIHSCKSLKKYNELSVTLITDKPYKLDLSIFDRVEYLDLELAKPLLRHHTRSEDWIKGIAFKIKGMLASPYKKTVFLDTDTEVLDDFSELFDILEHFELLAIPAPGDLQVPFWKGEKIKGLHPLNTGVLAFQDSTQVKELFEQWLVCFLRNSDKYLQDQPALTEAMLTKPVKFFPLSILYHLRTNCYVGIPANKVKILHGRYPKEYDMNLRVNGSTINRGWIPNFKRTFGLKRFYRDWLRKIILKQKKLNFLRKS